MAFCAPSTRNLLTAKAVVLALLIAGAGVKPAQASHGQPLHERKHDAKRQVEALEEEWRQAQLSGDVTTMDNLLSDDYIGISLTGQVNTKTQQLDRVRLKKIILTRIDLGEMQVKLVGAIAIVTSRAEVEGINEGMPIKGTYRYTRVYQRLPSGVWKITSFEATRVPGAGNREEPKDPKALAAVPPSGPS